MGTGSGTDLTNIAEDLLCNGPHFSVWQAIRIGEIITKEKFPGRKDFLFDQAGIAFRPYENYEFPPTDIRKIGYHEGILTFTLNYLGLYGVNSPVPRCYHDQVAMQQRLLGEDEVPLRNFLDIFNNRFYWLYYQAWKKYKYHLHLSEGPDNKVTQRINSFIGKSIWKEKDASVPDYALLKFSGVLSSRVRNKTGLLMLLNYIFPFYEISIKEFIPRWIDIDDPPRLGDNFILGVNAFIGRSAVNYMSRIRIEFEPLSFREYLDFLPGSEKAERLNQVLKLYLNDGIEHDVLFRIRSSTIESVSWNDERIRLGSTIWLGKPQSEFTEVTIHYEEFINPHMYS